jgi:hypothetical protein
MEESWPVKRINSCNVINYSNEKDSYWTISPHHEKPTKLKPSQFILQGALAICSLSALIYQDQYTCFGFTKKKKRKNGNKIANSILTYNFHVIIDKLPF